MTLLNGNNFSKRISASILTNTRVIQLQDMMQTRPCIQTEKRPKVESEKEADAFYCNRYTVIILVGFKRTPKPNIIKSQHFLAVDCKLPYGHAFVALISILIWLLVVV